jgi:EAL domain-containing protein (putative c-di-GMP-specific phosphodiesterase class I)
MKIRKLGFLQKIVDIFKHFGWFSLLLIPIFFFVNWSFFATISAQKDAIVAEQKSIANQELNNIDFFINAQLASVHNDIHVIRDANETKTYIETPNDGNLTELRHLVYRISTNKAEFINSSVIDINGNELLKVTRDDGELSIVNDSALESIASHDYFNDIISLDQEILFIDQLRVVNQHPLLSLIAPIFDDGNLAYFIKIDYDADHFLSVFDLYTNDLSENFTFGLVNMNNVWFIDRTSNSLFKVLDPNFYQDTKDNNDYFIEKNISIEDEHNHYTSSGDSFFKAFIDIDMEPIINQSKSYALRFSWIIILINIVIVGFITYMAYIIKSKSDDRILLNANMYLSNKNTDAVIITEKDFSIYYVNEAFENYFGYTTDEVIGKRPRDVIGQIGLKLDYDHQEFKAYEGNLWNKTKDDIKIYKNLSVRKETSSTGKTKHYIGIYSEPQIYIDDYYKYMENKSEVIEGLTTILINQPLIKEQTFLFLIKVDNCDIHDLSKFIKGRLDKRYMVCIPKSNFILIYLNAEMIDLKLLMDHFDYIIQTYKHLTSTDRAFTHTLVSAKADESIDSIEELLQAIFIAYQLSKTNPQYKYHIYKHEMKSLIHREKQIYEALEKAFHNGEFYMSYQVQENLNDNTYVGAEALLRWENENLGQVRPDEFIPIIENSLFINQLSISVLDMVIKDFEPYYDIIPDNFRISVNLTNFDLNSDSIIDQLLNMIDHSILANTFFSFEITESNYIDNIEKANQVIKKFHDKDIILAIDDFGTGYSSISSLKSIDIDQVKIDRNFIFNYPEKDDGSMFKIIATLIHSLNKTIIVEGTETKEQVNFCKENHCHMAQGYFQSKPIPINDFVKRFLKQK